MLPQWLFVLGACWRAERAWAGFERAKRAAGGMASEASGEGGRRQASHSRRRRRFASTKYGFGFIIQLHLE